MIKHRKCQAKPWNESFYGKSCCNEVIVCFSKNSVILIMVSDKRRELILSQTKQEIPWLQEICIHSCSWFKHDHFVRRSDQVNAEHWLKKKIENLLNATTSLQLNLQSISIYQDSCCQLESMAFGSVLYCTTIRQQTHSTSTVHHSTVIVWNDSILKKQKYHS